MMEVLKYLEGGTLEGLAAELGIRVTRHPSDARVILNYDQIDSPKTHPVVRECRGLVLEQLPWGEWVVVARAFPRFYNAGEALEQTASFDWDDFTAREKHDGSLILLYYSGGSWRVNTRGSFAQGEVGQGVGRSWEQLFYEALGENAPAVGQMTPGFTFVFELCSPFNKVVRRYPAPTLFLLASFHNATGREDGDAVVADHARILGVARPAVVSYGSLPELQAYLEAHDDPTYEGVVCKDGSGTRLKVKNPRYVALHQLRGEAGNLFSPKHLLPFVLRGEADELLAYFPEAADACVAVARRLDEAEAGLLEAWRTAPHGGPQKEFALHVVGRTPLSSMLFAARSEGVEPGVVFRRSSDVLLRKLWGREHG